MLKNQTRILEYTFHKGALDYLTFLIISFCLTNYNVGY